MEAPETLFYSFIFATVIGGVISSATTFITQLIALWKEKSLFDKEQTAKEKEWERNAQKAELEYIRKIYQNAFSALSVFITAEDQKREENEERTDERKTEIQNIIKWVSQLTLRFPSNSELFKRLTFFTSSPNSSEAYRLREELNGLVERV